MADEVVKEMDVYLSKDLQGRLWLMQYPVRPMDNSYENEHFLSTKVKVDQKKVNIDLALDTTSSSYLSSKGEHLAMSVDGATSKGPPTYPSGKLDRIELKSAQGIPKCDRYAIAAVQGGSVHLTPLSAIVQMRPSLSFLDKADAASKAREKLLEMEDGSSQDEEEDVKAVTVKFARQETAEQKSRRMKSYDYMKRKQSEETWTDCTYHKTQTELSGRIRHRLLASNHESVDSYCGPSEYLSKLVPKQQNDTDDNPDMPSNVLSMSQLKNMSLNDRVKAIVTNAKVIRWSQLLMLLDKEVDSSQIMKAVQQVAVLVQGCWVVKSEILYPKDSFSAHNSSPAEVICRARDYVLWRFRQSPSLFRKDISHIVKIPSEELTEMLEQVARPKPKFGWMFNFEYDSEFVGRHKDVVERQNKLWDARYQQLQKHFDPAKVGETSKGRRRRHSSRSKSRSEASDNEGEKSSVVEMQEPTVNGDGEGNHTGASRVYSDDMVSELSSLLREKLLINYVFTMSDLKRIYQTKLAQCPPGHVLATGVTDTLLEKTIISCGATKVHYMNPPGSAGTFYMLTNAGDHLDASRLILAQTLQKSNRIKSNTFREALQQNNVAFNDDQLIPLVKNYCSFKAGFWSFKGTVES